MDKNKHIERAKKRLQKIGEILSKIIGAKKNKDYFEMARLFPQLHREIRLFNLKVHKELKKVIE